jgi:diadenosine tetraphosphate (Ap4A) HIT family hydrolase
MKCGWKISPTWRNMPEAFALHPQIVADTLPAFELNLCTVRLMNARALPWLILVPKRPGIREIIDLEPPDQATLWDEITTTAAKLKAACNPHKLNIAALGNVVPQLHVHIVARYENDPAWPKPVWGNLPMDPYGEDHPPILALLQ